MRRNLPPLNPLRIFEAAARHVHFTRAADEIGITQAAVSRQISVLEKWLNVELFERRHTELRLTAAGKIYLETLRHAFDLIDNTTAKILNEPIHSRIRLRSYNTFALLWLVPRLPLFRKKHPDIQVDLLTSVASLEFQRDDQADLIISYGTAKPEGVVAQRIFEDVIVPVCSPNLLSDEKSITSPSDLKNYTLLHSRYRSNDWSDWASHINIDINIDTEPGLVFGSSTLVYQAAKAGIGIAMGQIRLLEFDLASGALMIPLNMPVKRNAGYFLLHSKEALRDARIVAFREWIMEEANKSGHG